MATIENKKQSSADKTLEILMALGELGMASGGGVRISDLVRHVGHPRPTVHRLLGELKRFGFAGQDTKTLEYRLGPKILLLSAQCLGGLDLKQAAQSRLGNLVEEVGGTGHIGVLDDVNVIYIDKVEARSGARLASSIGQRRRAVSTALGKAILAFSDAETVDDVLSNGLGKATPNSISDPVAFRNELVSVARSKSAIDDEECEIGIRCAAAPVFDNTGKVIAAISVSLIAGQISRSDLKKLADRVSVVAEAISADLGAPA